MNVLKLNGWNKKESVGEKFENARMANATSLVDLMNERIYSMSNVKDVLSNMNSNAGGIYKARNKRNVAFNEMQRSFGVIADAVDKYGVNKIDNIPAFIIQDRNNLRAITVVVCCVKQLIVTDDDDADDDAGPKKRTSEDNDKDKDKDKDVEDEKETPKESANETAMAATTTTRATGMVSDAVDITDENKTEVNENKNQKGDSNSNENNNDKDKTVRLNPQSVNTKRIPLICIKYFDAFRANISPIQRNKMMKEITYDNRKKLMQEIHASLQEMTMIAQVFKNNRQQIDKTVLNQTEAKFISRQNEKMFKCSVIIPQCPKDEKAFQRLDSCPVCGNQAVAACSRCKKVRYCSASCQRMHWKLSHKRECVQQQ